jgi:hypothetical protein
VFGVPLPHVMYITYTQFQLPLPVLHACEFLRKGNGTVSPLATPLSQAYNMRRGASVPPPSQSSPTNACMAVGTGHHLATEGIFRVPGSAEEVANFKAKYNIGTAC